MPKVLVLDADQNCALAIIRSLGKAGIDVISGSSNSKSIGFYSRWSKRNLIYPDPFTDKDKFCYFLKKELSSLKYDLVIPVTDRTILPIIDVRRELETLSRIAIPASESLMITYNKEKTFSLAKKMNIPFPYSFTVHSIDEIIEYEDHITYPIVLKPQSSKVWKDGVGYDRYVEYAFNSFEMKEKLKKILNVGPVIIQNYCKGMGVGIALLMRKGEPLAAFQYERIHEVPLTGGGSSYRKSVPLKKNLYEYSVKMLKALKWTGVAMVEFKVDRDSNQIALMEINGRFWGSLPLAIYSGINFPFLLYKMLVNNNAIVKNVYNNNIYCRCLAKEIQWIKESIKVDKNNLLIKKPTIIEIISDMLKMFRIRDRFDVLSVSDPLPGIIDFYRIIHKESSSIVKKYLRLFNIFSGVSK